MLVCIFSVNGKLETFSDAPEIDKRLTDIFPINFCVMEAYCTCHVHALLVPLLYRNPFCTCRPTHAVFGKDMRQIKIFKNTAHVRIKYSYSTLIRILDISCIWPEFNGI
jgi:hypothetical protein